MKLYQSPKAPTPDRVVYFLRAKGQLDSVDLVDVNIMAQEHKTPEYRAISPFAKVPALVLDDGKTLTESRAICTYFEALFPEPNLMGETPLEKAQIEMWDRQIELMFFVHLAAKEIVAAGRFSIADITDFISCGFCRVMQWAPHKEHEHLGAWYSRMKAMGFSG